MTAFTDVTSDRMQLIAGNWKMNMDHSQGRTLLSELARTLTDMGHNYSRAEVAVFPPFTSIGAVQAAVQDADLQVAYGGQDLSPFDSGAHTGDISGQFLAKLGCAYVLVGHSERRTMHHESGETLKSKVAAAFRNRLTPILCVGEGLEIRRAGNHVKHTLAQLRAAVEDLTADQASELVVAYEPVWAIGTGEVAGPEDAQEMCAAIRTELSRLFDGESAAKTRLLYGGSVKASNAAAILNGADVDGALVGGASLDATEFAKIAAS
ncbi:triose-phosphate isomerase [Arthrobacter sp. AFG20]|uniref:triose-phosphate isomerase n=1 Tax=Arthrobacter sp. AFG20 TaxID=1688671 RepID=UPI000C9E27EC|nr:triose-phosphate isomerase [Arthrobacter sp. AFG20]PNH78924.1 triose-phosphate isomerase [Arthrobacter sp. AFG20]